MPGGTGSHDDGQGVGYDGDGQVAVVAGKGHAVTPDPHRSAEVEHVLARTCGRERWVGQVATGAGPPSRLAPISEGKTTRGEVEQPVVRVGPGPQIPLPQPLGIHHDGTLAQPPAPPRHEMGDEPMLRSVGEPDHADVNREHHSPASEATGITGTPHGPTQVAPEQPDHQTVDVGQRCRRHELGEFRVR